MRALTWFLGVLVVLAGLQSKPSDAPAWTAVWVSAAVLWFFLGVGLLVLMLSKVVTGKMGAGLNAASRQPRPEVPAPKEHHGT